MATGCDAAREVSLLLPQQRLLWSLALGLPGPPPHKQDGGEEEGRPGGEEVSRASPETGSGEAAGEAAMEPVTSPDWYCWCRPHWVTRHWGGGTTLEEFDVPLAGIGHQCAHSGQLRGIAAARSCRSALELARMAG